MFSGHTGLSAATTGPCSFSEHVHHGNNLWLVLRSFRKVLKMGLRRDQKVVAFDTLVLKVTCWMCSGDVTRVVPTPGLLSYGSLLH